MKRSRSRAAFLIKRAIQNPRSVCNRSSLYRCVRPRNCHGSVLKVYAPDRTPHRTAHRHQRRSNKDDALTFSSRQKRRLRRRSHQSLHRNLMPYQLRHCRKIRRDWHRKRHGYAQMIYDCVLNRKCRSIRQPQHRRNLDGVLSLRKQQMMLQKRLFGSRCLSVRSYPMCQQPRSCRACA